MTSPRIFPALLALLPLGFPADADPLIPEVAPRGSYVVVASEPTAAADGWRDVVRTLREKYDGSLILHPEGRVAAALPALKTLRPRYAAFVARPEEAGRSCIVAIHRLTRKLDDDPYTDLRWGVVTGYNAADALRIARRRKPLVIDSAASSMGPGCFKALDHGFASFETDRHKFAIRKPGGETETIAVDPDPVQHLVEAFNSQSPDLFITSGHATEKNWQVIFNKNAGYFKCDHGQLYGEDSKKQRFDINAPGAKVYLPMGNCLIGHIPKPDCMATAWMHTGGVHQMFGYTVVTFHGYMGWGIGSFMGEKYSLSEAFYFNNQSLIRELEMLFPEQAGVEFASYDPRQINRLAKKHNISDRKVIGHLWDRDAVAFYGDPAWVARHRLSNPAWRASWQHTGESAEITVAVLENGTWGNRPLAIPFPVRLDRVRGIDCSHDLEPVVTDDFALLPVMGRERKAGDTITLRFGGFAVACPPTSADADPILATMTADPPPVDQHRPVDHESLGLPKRDTRAIAIAMHFAGENRRELDHALRRSTPEERADTGFLIANMPHRDLIRLDADFLIENVRYARRARDEAPWNAAITPELYRDGILPYANLSEKREPWRKQFYERCKPLIAGCTTPGAAAVTLNTAIYDQFKVTYHATRRPRPDQGPLESIAAGYASCTGLAILLVNACRSVGIPARVAGVAQWTEGPGNHTWAEVWDNGWHCLGASESRKLDDVWFGKGAAAADAGDPMKRVYAARFTRGTLRFPLAWNPYADYIPAVDVTDWYRMRFGATPGPKQTP